MKKILFIGAGNICRSQMAEAWTRKLMPSILEPYSAGVKPGTLDQLSVKAMAEADIDISEYQPKHVLSLEHIQFDCVITLCLQAYESCPVLPEKTRKLHRMFDDPGTLAEKANNDKERMDCYRWVRAQLRELVETLPEILKD